MSLPQDIPSASPGTPPLLPPEVTEELAHLARTNRLLAENPEAPPASEDDVVSELIRIQDEYRVAKVEDRGALQEQQNQLSARLDALRSARITEVVDPDSPYFAHLRTKEGDRVSDIFLGRATRLGSGLRIVDWRNAPISKLFYRYDEGDEYIEEFNGREHDGEVLIRRTLHVAEASLWRVGNRQVSWVREGEDWRVIDRQLSRLAGGEGASLYAGERDRASLGAGVKHRADKHLPDIAALIDPEQFALITRPDSGVVVLRGSAGSGKTTVALHRIAYLSYQGGRRFPHQRVLVIVWGRAMRDYVQHVLPALGVEGVKVTTWLDWSTEILFRHLPGLIRKMAPDTPEPVSRMKLHPGVAEALADHIARTPGRSSADQVLDDWSRVITDPEILQAAMGSDISEGAMERAMRWTIDQVEAVKAWWEGDHKVEAWLDTEDTALLLRAWQLRVGKLRAGAGGDLRYVHIVLDEVQDFSPVEVQVLLDTTDKNRSVTLAGDTRQHISKEAGFASWTEFLERIGIESTALATLEVSYRSTHPIIRFALEVLEDDSEPPPRTERDGPPVELFRFSDHGAAVTYLGEELSRLQRAEPLANIALITPSPELSELYARGLIQAEVGRVRLVENQQFAFAAGVDVVEAAEVKGLEFDYVVLVEVSAAYWPDTPHHRRLLHVAATRAVHQLWLTSVGTPSSILPTAGG